MTDNTTITLTWMMELSAPLTDKEKDTIIGNLWEHIHNERHEGIPGFTKIAHVTAPDGKYRVTIDDVLGSVESAFCEEGKAALARLRGAKGKR